MLGELYGFVRSGGVNFDCLKPLEYFAATTPIANTRYIIGNPPLDLLDG
jgi:hypothetical protein